MRESEIETAINIRLILDATASMRHADASNPTLTKFDLARTLAAALALLAAAKAIRSACTRSSAKAWSPSCPDNTGSRPNASAHAWQLSNPPAAGPPTPAARGRVRSAAGTSREIIIVLTDGHEQTDEIRAALAPLRSRGHELLWFQLVGRDEEDFPFHGLTRFEDWETGATFETDADAAHAAWVDGYERHARAWRRDWAGSGRFDAVRFLLDEPPGKVLRAYLRQRQK